MKIAYYMFILICGAAGMIEYSQTNLNPTWFIDGRLAPLFWLSILLLMINAIWSYVQANYKYGSPS